ncbi:EH signature domain-containing protein [Sphaerospermopsis sp. LEGE 08334]|uniref:EH signature domain-containing protein n=1 Tax=Sphaerospermopsis sp. LEGE 08334 TaxID=1828651 RepID=UPI001D1345FB|nr:EH signature domain-containing protein [Sphaerospermopsis sp. LEGE 08334]
MFNQKFNLQEFSVPDHQPHRLIELAAKQKSSNINLSISALKEKIEQNRIQDISLIEWIWCIDNERIWEEIPEVDRKDLSLKIWHISQENQWLYFTLIRRLAWFYHGQKNVITSHLVNGFILWSNSISVKDNLVIKILVALGANEPKKAMVKIICDQNLTHNELLPKINHVLPNLTIFKDYVLEIAPYFTKQLHPVTLDKVNWLLRCFEQMEETEQIQSVEYILNHLSTSIVGRYPELVNWLKTNYHNSSKQSKLSSQARQKLRIWIGAVNYQDFSNLVDLIIQRIGIKDKEENQLNKRQGFWANYSNSFMRIKILLPMQSYQIINHDLRTDQDVQRLQSDGSDETEICIFDLGENGFIVEFFRGRGSETRIFPQNDYIESVLFGSQPLSVKKIRKLGGKAHDHTLGWQWSCEKLLRTDYQILPNTGTTNFIGLPPKYGRYDVRLGLPQPDYKKLTERQNQVQKWKQIINQLESEAKQSPY